MWNKIAALLVLATVTGLLLNPVDTDARGGGRGGGGGGRGGGGGGARGGGGAYRGGHTMNRTPSMNRASGGPNVSQARQQAQARPAGTQRNVQQARQVAQQRSSVANHAELRNQVNRYAQNRPAPSIDRQALAQRSQNFSSKHAGQIAQNRQLSDRVSQRLQQSHPGSRNWFDKDFFDRHNINRDFAGLRGNWWQPAAWATLASWGAWNWSTPYYYDNDGYAYPYSTTTTISQPVQTQSVEGTSTGVEWLPLGVFAVGRDAEAAVQSNRFIQLAINRSGEIAGVLYNATTDSAQDITGMVDPSSQKAYWSLTNRTNSPIASTGIYNLTEDQTSINVHFSDGSDQTWTLVRLKQ